MRKTIVFLTALCLLFGTAACADNGSDGTEAGEYTLKMADFDDYDDIYNMLMQYYNTSTLGRWEINKDEKYIREGTGSAKWVTDAVVAESWTQTRMDCAQPMVTHYYLSNNYNVDLVDMSSVKCISVDCYNANDFDITFAGCIFTNENLSFADASVTVKPGTWETLKIGLNTFLADTYVTSVKNVVLSVDYAHRVMTEKSYVADVGQLYFPQSTVYLDNMYAVIDERETKVDKKFADENEILYFDDISDMKYADVFLNYGERDWSEMYQLFPQGVAVRYNTNPCFTNGKSGSLELRLDPFHTRTRQWLTNATYRYELAGVEFLGVVDKVNFLPLQTDNAKVAIDVYNDFDFDKEVFFGMDDNVHGFNYVTETEYPYEIGNSYPLYNMYKLKAKQWTTIYFDRADELDLSKGVARIKFASSKLDVNKSGCFYLNNLRLVKEER